MVTTLRMVTVSKSANTERVVLARLLSCLLATAGVSAHAENWSGTAGVSVGETYSDNIGRQSKGFERDDWATEVSPYIHYGGRSARANGTLDAKLRNVRHTDGMTSNASSLQLNAAGTLEAYEDLLFVDALVNQDKQRISQFAAADSSYGGTANSTQVTRYNFSPNMHWRLGDATDARLRYTYEEVHADKANFAAGHSDTLQLNLVNGAAFGRLGWGFSATKREDNPDTTIGTSSSSYSGSLSYAFDPALSGQLFGGQEFNDYDNGAQRHYWNWGAGLKWVPDDRTTVSAQTTKRFFGRGFAYSVEHRMKRSSLAFNYGREVNTLSSSSDFASRVYSDEYYYFDLLFKSIYPNDAQRDAVVRQTLTASGYPLYRTGTQGVLSSQSYVDRRMSVLWTLLGVRNTLTLSIHSSDKETLTQQILSGLVSGDLSTYQRIKQRGWDAMWRHNLTPDTSMGVRYGWASVTGYGVAPAPTYTTSHSSTIGLNLDTKLAPYTTGGLFFTHTRSQGSVAFTENALGATLNHQF